MRNIMRYLHFSLSVLVAALQLITFWLAILANELTPACYSQPLRYA